MRFSTASRIPAATAAPLNPGSLSQLFDRVVRLTAVPRIRFQDVGHTHASLLIAAGVPVKVVGERLGHAHPASP